MTDTPRHYSPREVRRRIWQTLRKHLLPLMLALLALSLPALIGGYLAGKGDAYLIQAREEKEHLWEMAQAPGWSDNWENQELLFEAWERESRLKSDASLLALIAAALHLVGRFLAMPLLFGVNLVLINILRGHDFAWRDARITLAEFRRGFKLQCYILVLMIIMELPGFLVSRFGGVISSWGWNGIVCLAVTLLGELLQVALPFLAMLRYHMAPRLLANGAEGTSSELVDHSAEILDVRSLLPQFSILFPGFLMVAAVWVLHVFGLQLLLPRAVAGVLRELLYLPGYAYLLAGSAAIYVTFRTE